MVDLEVTPGSKHVNGRYLFGGVTLELMPFLLFQQGILYMFIWAKDFHETCLTVQTLQELCRGIH